MARKPGSTRAADVERKLEELKNANKVSRGIVMFDEAGDALSPLMQRLLGFEPSLYATLGPRQRRMHRLYRPEFHAAFEGVDRAQGLFDSIDVRRRLLGRAPVHQSPYLWGKTILPDYILTLLGDRMEAASIRK